MKTYIFFLTIFFNFFLYGSDGLEEEDGFYRIEDVVRTTALCPNHWHAILNIEKFYNALYCQDYDTLSQIMQRKVHQNDADLYQEAQKEYARYYIMAHIENNQEMINSLYLGSRNGWSPIQNPNLFNMFIWTLQQKHCDIAERFLWDKDCLTYITRMLANSDSTNDSITQSILLKFTRSKHIEYLKIFTGTSKDFPPPHLIGIALEKASENNQGETAQYLLHKILTHKNTILHVNIALNKAALNNHDRMIPYFLIYIEQDPDERKFVLLNSLKIAIGRKNKAFIQKIFETKYRPKGKDISDLLKIKTTPEIKHILRSKLLFLGKFRACLGF